MNEWDERWYAAWQILLAKLTLAEIQTLAAAFDVTRPKFWFDGDSDEEERRHWISAIGDRLREQRDAVAFAEKTRPMLQTLKELLGIWR